jgi:hypothetical protein
LCEHRLAIGRAGGNMALMLPLLLALAAVSGGGCDKCHYEGVIACKAHAKDGEEPSAENPLEFCSWAAHCEACAGVLWIDCSRCDGGPRSAEFEARKAAATAWNERNALEKTLGRAVGRLETKHFALVVDLEELPDGNKRISGHALAHRLALDLEHTAALVSQHFQAQDTDYRAKMRMWIFTDLETHKKAMEGFLGTVSTGDFKVLGRDPVFSVWAEPPHFETAPKARAVFVHNAAHMLMSNAFEPVWVGDTGGGWLDAGLGHWYEYEAFGRTLNYCIEEATAMQNWENGQWRAPIRKWLDKESTPLLPGVFSKRTGAMTQRESAVCWSFYDFLVAEHPDTLRGLMVALKKKDKEGRVVLKEQLGLDLAGAEAAWRAWVSETYPVQGDKPRAGGGKKSR